MKLTNNEKSTLSFLIQNARTTDADIARKLRISLQAVRNIRKKLEKKKIIKMYSTVVDYEKIGINLFAIVLFKVTAEAWDGFKETNIEKWLLHPNVINLYRIPHGDITHIIKYGFSDLNEMASFFQTLQSKYSRYIEIEKSYIVSNGDIVRNSNHILVDNIIKGKNLAAKPFVLE